MLNLIKVWTDNGKELMFERALGSFRCYRCGRQFDTWQEFRDHLWNDHAAQGWKQ